MEKIKLEFIILASTYTYACISQPNGYQNTNNNKFEFKSYRSQIDFFQVISIPRLLILKLYFPDHFDPLFIVL